MNQNIVTRISLFPVYYSVFHCLVQLILYGGTNKEIDFEYIDEVLSHFSTGDVIVLQNEINNVPYIIDRCYEKEMKIFFNAAPYDESIQNYPIEKVTCSQ